MYMENEINKLVNEIEDLYFLEKEGNVYRSVIDSLEKPLLQRILKMTKWNQLKAAKMLGINRNTLRTKLRHLGIPVKQ
jgi:DNA-binding protein Fis